MAEQIEADREVWQLLRDRIRMKLLESDPPEGDELRRLIEREVFESPEDPALSLEAKARAIQRIFDALRGLDLLQPLVDDPSVTEIMVNRHDEIYIERGGRMERFEEQFESEEKLQDVIQTIAGSVNRAVNEASPIVDARLSDGSRVHAVLPPIALKGPTLTIRKFPARTLLMEDLIEMGSIPESAAMLLKRLIQAGYNVFVCGGTGSGKTTLLNAFVRWIPLHERLVTIEDAAELQIETERNAVRMETRNANAEGKGEVTIRDLIRASLRMRPDRIIVGEVRGAEALDMLQAMNTGHDGSLSTGHANSPLDMISRLETMVHSGAHLPIAVIRKQIASAIDVVVQVSRFPDGTRKVIEISEIIGYADEQVKLEPLYDWQGGTSGELRQTDHSLRHIDKLRMAGMEEEAGDVGLSGVSAVQA